jgi:tetratricopeptide (TPR) repeat protein
LLAFVVGILAVPSTAVADGWFSKMGKTKDTTLGEILRHPHAFVDVRVEFKLYFNQPGESYNPYYTRFTEELYGNFTAWPIDARLYDKRDYQRTYQFFFMTRQSKKWKKLQGLDRMTVIEVTGYVREVFRGQPWIEIEKFSTTSGGMRARDVQYVINGDAYYAAGKYEQAKRYYKKSISRRIPDLVRADLYRRLADTLYHQGKYRDALHNYYNGLDKAPRSLVLKQGIAATKAAMAREKASRRGQPTPETIQLPAPREKPVTRKDNDVWEIIQLMEDPAKVEAEVEAWNLELAKRAALVRAPTGVTAVSDEETVEEDVVEEESSEEMTAEEETTEEVVDEGWAEETPEQDSSDESDGEESYVDESDVESDEEVPAERDTYETTEDWGDADETVEETIEIDESVGEVVADDPRVVMVAGQVIRLPRLPFVGCADVTVQDLRTIVEEVIRNPDQ